MANLRPAVHSLSITTVLNSPFWIHRDLPVANYYQCIARKPAMITCVSFIVQSSCSRQSEVLLTCSIVAVLFGRYGSCIPLNWFTGTEVCGRAWAITGGGKKLTPAVVRDQTLHKILFLSPDLSFPFPPLLLRMRKTWKGLQTKIVGVFVE